jgi:hypothetical protein
VPVSSSGRRSNRPGRSSWAVEEAAIGLDQAIAEYRAAIDPRDRLDRDLVIVARTGPITRPAGFDDFRLH